MSAITLKTNGRSGGLIGNGEFVGFWESVDKWSKFKVSIWNTGDIELYVEQSPDGTHIDRKSAYQVPRLTTDKETEVAWESNNLFGGIFHPFFRIRVVNPTAVPIDECRIWVQAYQNGHLKPTEDSVSIYALDADTTAVRAVNLITDGDGKRRLCVDASVSVEDIKLDATTDSITIFGTSAGVPTAVAVDALGSVITKDAEVLAKVEELNVKTTEGNALLELIEEGVRKENSTIAVQQTPASFATGEVIGDVIDLSPVVGANHNKFNNVIFMGYIDTTTNTNPRLMFQFSHQGGVNDLWYADGTEASYYKPVGSNIWTFYIQRDKIATRYVRLIAISATDVVNVYATLSKN